MRIIAGRFKGRKLKTPSDASIRPIMDRVKEWIFNVIQNELDTARVLDLFAGTGSFGFEAISRGATDVTFVDQSPAAIRIIHQNAGILNPPATWFAVQQNVSSYLRHAHPAADVIFADPPYDFPNLERLPETILQSGILNPDGILIVEHHASVKLPETVDDFSLMRDKKFGKTIISMYWRPDADSTVSGEL